MVCIAKTGSPPARPPGRLPPEFPYPHLTCRSDSGPGPVAGFLRGSPASEWPGSNLARPLIKHESKPRPSSMLRQSVYLKVYIQRPEANTFTLLTATIPSDRPGGRHEFEGTFSLRCAGMMPFGG